MLRYGTDGSLDPTFGTGGVVKTSISASEDVATALIAQPDGKLVLTGIASPSSKAFALARYNLNGSLDESFGDGGIVVTQIAEFAHPSALALQHDGKLVVGGDSYTFPAFNSTLARYNPDGSLDSSFGNNGVVINELGTEENDTDWIAAVAVHVSAPASMAVSSKCTTTRVSPPSGAMPGSSNRGSCKG